MSEKSANSSKRAANYSKEECWRLIEIIEKHAGVIENKKMDALTWKEKKMAWQTICQTFNSTSMSHRTWEQLRSKYETLKKETRRAVAKNKNSMLGTGGGPFEENLNPLYEKIRTLIKLSCDGIPSQFDSDRLDTQTQSTSALESKYNITEVPSPRSPLLINTEPCASSSISAPINVQDDLLLEIEDWSSYSPAKLKTPKHRALQTKKRKRISDVSVAGQKLQPWVDAKAELTNFKKQLLQKEFDAKQGREQELHEQQLQINNQIITINNLTIKKMEMEIEILTKKGGI